MIHRRPAPEKTLPGQLLLSIEGACTFDPGRLLEVFGEQRQRFAAVLRSFGPGDWAAPTRCTDWSAHDVVRHLCDGTMKLAAAGPDDRTLDLAAGFDPRITPRGWPAVSAVEPPGATFSRFLETTEGGNGGGVFDLDSRGSVTLTVTRVTAAGPPAAEVADALAGRSPVAAVLGDLPASSRAALARMGKFFNTPVEQSPAAHSA